jgi:uncharacterized protein
MDGKDYYKSLAPYLVTFSFEDNCTGEKADDLEIVLADRDKRFITDWMPQKGAFIDAGIVASQWFTPFAADLHLDCGRFWIDTITFELPEHTVTIKGSSLPTNARIKANVESRGWDDITLKDVATKLTKESQMDIDYPDDIRNPRYARTEMHDESALEYLKKRAENAKLAMKISKNKISFYDEQKREESEPKFSLLYGNLTGVPSTFTQITNVPTTGAATPKGAIYRLEGGTFTTTLNDTTKKAKVKHTSVEDGETKQGEATMPQDVGPDGQPDPDDVMPDELDQNVPEDTDDADEASTVAEGREGQLREAEPGSPDQWNAASTTKAESIVRKKNKFKYQATLKLGIGNPLVAAGMTFNLVGVGQYDGKWIIDSAHHDLAPQYNTELKCHRCLKGI